MPIKNMTPEQIAEVTRAQVASGAKSTDRANRLPGETATEANARITAAYKEMTAKPILSQEQIDGGMKVQFVRTGAGGVGEYVPIKPLGYTGPTKVTEFTPGVIPANSKYTTGTSVGFNPDDYKTEEDMQRIAAKAASGATLTPDEQALLNKGAKPSTASTVKTADTQSNIGVSKTSAPQFPNDPTDLIAMMNRLNELSTKSRSGTAGMGPDKGKVFSGGLTPEEIAEYDRIYLNVQEGLKTGRPVYSVQNPDGTRTLTYNNPNPEAGNQAIGPNGFPDGSINLSYTPGAIPTGTNTGATSFGVTTDAERSARQSAYDLLYQQFDSYGLSSLVEPLKGLIVSGSSPAEFTIKLRETDAYKKRFAANAKRIANGLAVIDEAEYIGLEDQYQKIMRNYGLPASYYAKGDLGRQEGFENLIANDVSNTELEDRIMTAQSRVLNANPEVLASLKAFYPDITNGDILAYTLNPTKGLSEIKRKVTAAEIGGAATQAGLGLTSARAEELSAAGVDKGAAREGFQAVAELAPRGGQLAAMYGESPYTQQTAEAEVFGLAGSTEARQQRKKLKSLEEASFSGRSGAAQGALSRERAGNL